MTTTLPSKRINRSEGSHTERAHIDATQDELTARLQSVGSRVRKSVMEGYITDRSASVPTSSYSSPTKPKSTPRWEARIFQSANDTLREVYSTTGGYGSPHLSPNKRERAQSEDPDSETYPEVNDIEMQASDSGNAGTSFSHTFADEDATYCQSRPVKPLKGSGRQLAQTRSLPIGSFQFSGQWQTNDRAPDLGTKTVEEDWSNDPFLDSKPRREMEFD
ncbi:hypothetical protein PILCRDRAFT_811262 [Piloderma croceum F 1598]|uniref:Uncharacterized protein n=1 Tax=Piloderma croceum (strain F 1598) TaxID=765440 RepID=A0A0C3GGK3_PILCF|nr:hypothetical protein PILCRDRAFT_811262 [Piloderma croceum F 1598]